jgi:hypothetical protein
VDWFTPTAFFGTTGQPQMFAQPDLGPGGGVNLLQPKDHANLIMLGVMSVLGLPLLAGFGYCARGRWRAAACAAARRPRRTSAGMRRCGRPAASAISGRAIRRFVAGSGSDASTISRTPGE